jgi:hypothetical protein
MDEDERCRRRRPGCCLRRWTRQSSPGSRDFAQGASSTTRRTSRSSGPNGEPVSATRGLSPNCGGSSSYNTALACWWIAAARRRARRSQPRTVPGRRRTADGGRRTAQPRGDHAMPLAGGGIQQRGGDHLGPVAPVRHRPRRKQYVRLRAGMARRPLGPPWRTARSVRTGRSRPGPSASAARRNRDGRSGPRGTVS